MLLEGCAFVMLHADVYTMLQQRFIRTLLGTLLPCLTLHEGCSFVMLHSHLYQTLQQCHNCLFPKHRLDVSQKRCLKVVVSSCYQKRSYNVVTTLNGDVVSKHCQKVWPQCCQKVALSSCYMLTYIQRCNSVLFGHCFGTLLPRFVATLHEGCSFVMLHADVYTTLQHRFIRTLLWNVASTFCRVLSVP